ncbi:hypothetical protein ACOMHN_060064 [Nucella lapillus]
MRNIRRKRDRRIDIGHARAQQNGLNDCGNAFYYSVLESPSLNISQASCLTVAYRRKNPAALDVFLELDAGEVLTLLNRSNNAGYNVKYNFTTNVNPGIGKIIFRAYGGGGGTDSYVAIYKVTMKTGMCSGSGEYEDSTDDISQSFGYIDCISQSFGYLDSISQSFGYIDCISQSFGYLDCISQSFGYLDCISQSFGYLDCISQSFGYLDRKGGDSPGAVIGGTVAAVIVIIIVVVIIGVYLYRRRRARKTSESAHMESDADPPVTEMAHGTSSNGTGPADVPAPSHYDAVGGLSPRNIYSGLYEHDVTGSPVTSTAPFSDVNGEVASYYNVGGQSAGDYCNVGGPATHCGDEEENQYVELV